jgi:hypothetical protein
MAKQTFNQDDIILYKTEDGPSFQVRLKGDTVWLDTHLIAKLFDVKRPAIVKHIHKIYKTKELEKDSTCSILEQVAADGKIRKMNIYNLDMIISVGYRVNSKRATQFRIWATKTLKEHLIKGYTINQERLFSVRNNFDELTETIEFLKNKVKEKLLLGQEQEILSLLSDYSKSLSLLEQYDKDKLSLNDKGKEKYKINLEDASEIIKNIKEKLIKKKEASEIFGLESGEKFKSILGNIYQTFGGNNFILHWKRKLLIYFIL